jgi:hypothetical protein
MGREEGEGRPEGAAEGWEGEAVSRAPKRPRVREIVQRSWSVPDDAPALNTERFEALVRAAVASGLVAEWDDGRGRCTWYNARRGPEERKLLAACVSALGAEPAETGLTVPSRDAPSGWMPPRGARR